MAKSGRIKALERGLSRSLKPALEKHGFHYVARTRGFYRTVGECIQIIEFQPGVRSAEGNFTVNLGVYHPAYHDPNAADSQWPREYDCLMEYRARLGSLRESWRTRFFKSIFSETSHWLKWWLTSMPEKWWPFSEDEGRVRASLSEVLALLERRGLSWLDENTDVDAMQACYAKLPARSGAPT